MKRMIFNVAAESSGALGILNQFHQEAALNEKDITYFVVSKPELESSKNIIILKFPWVKKSWFHRFYFDYFISHRLAKMYGVDEILSLQNIKVPITNLKQTIYIHNALPFSTFNFIFFLYPRLFVHQFFSKILIMNSIKSVNNIIVQTKSMSRKVMKINPNAKVKIKPPIMQITNIQFQQSSYKNEFIYPATAFPFKNHKIIINAVEILLKKGINNFEIKFTLDNSSTYSRKLLRYIIKRSLPISFIGIINQEILMNMYTSNILVFSSKVESYPLPIREAMSTNTPIIAYEEDYSKELLSNYNNVEFYNNYQKLAEIIESKIIGVKVKYE